MIINSFIFSSAPSYTARTTAFATATGITDATILGALNTFDLGLISNSLDSKMKAIYPFVGGTASTHKYNFMNAVDSNSAFRLVFSGGGTHSSNGYQPAGVNGYANTNFKPNLNASGIDNFHNSYYSRTNVNLVQIEMGGGASDADGTLLEIRTSDVTYIRVNSGTPSNFADTNSQGFYTQSRATGLLQKGFKNGVLKVSGASSSTTNVVQDIYLGAYNSNGTPKYYTSKECAFASIGDSLTDGEATTFYNLVQAMQVTLSRNV